MYENTNENIVKYMDIYENTYMKIYEKTWKYVEICENTLK